MTRRRVLILALVGVPVAGGDAYSYVSARGRTPTEIAVGNGRLARMDTSEREAAARPTASRVDQRNKDASAARATITVRVAEFDLANYDFERGRGRVVRDAISHQRVEQLTAEEL